MPSGFTTSAEAGTEALGSRCSGAARTGDRRRSASDRGSRASANAAEMKSLARLRARSRRERIAGGRPGTSGFSARTKSAVLATLHDLGRLQDSRFGRRSPAVRDGPCHRASRRQPGPERRPSGLAPSGGGRPGQPASPAKHGGALDISAYPLSAAGASAGGSSASSSRPQQSMRSQLRAPVVQTRQASASSSSSAPRATSTRRMRSAFTESM